MFDERRLPASAPPAPLISLLHSPFRSPVTPHVPSSLLLSVVPVSTSDTDPRRGCPDLVSPVQMVQIGKVRLSDIAPYEGALEEHYVREVEALCGSLTRHNAVVVELYSQDAAVIRFGLESSRMYFKAKELCGGGGSGNDISGSKNGRGSYIYRSGSGTFLEDAMVVSCGHPFGGQLVKKVIEMGRCALCDSEIETGPLVPNYALRAAATAVRSQDEKRLFHNSAIRKRRKENGDMAIDTDSVRIKRGSVPFHSKRESND